MRKLLFVLAVALTTVFGSCNKCKNISCENGGSCDDGSCSCPTFYEGTYCSSEVRDRYVGTYELITTINIPFFGTQVDTARTALTPLGTDITKLSLFMGDTDLEVLLTDVSGNFTVSGMVDAGGQDALLEGSGAFNATGFTSSSTVNIQGIFPITAQVEIVGTKL